MLLRFLTVCLLAWAGWLEAAEEAKTLPLSIAEGERVLIFAPHPDDEMLSAAGLSKQVLDKAGSVRMVVVTSGDAYVGAVMLESGKKNPAAADYLDFGEKRLHESQRAAE